MKDYLKKQNTFSFIYLFFIKFNRLNRSEHISTYKTQFARQVNNNQGAAVCTSLKYAVVMQRAEISALNTCFLIAKYK